MTPDLVEPLDYVPIVPERVQKKHHIHQPLDTRFRSAARLLQSLWRQDRGLPIGEYKREDGKVEKLGSRISDKAAVAGANFINAKIAQSVYRELAYRELGAMIDEERMFTNLLSSMPLAFNLFVPLKHDLVKCECAMNELISSFAGEVTQVLFEHSPGRGNPKFLGDYSAFDVFIRYTTPEKRPGFVAIEIKYSESMREPIPKMRERYDTVAETCRLFRDPSDPGLRQNPLQQLFREHMLAQTMLGAGMYSEGYFVVIAPEFNHLAQQAIKTYQPLLELRDHSQVRFMGATLENLINVIRLTDPEHANALHQRYADWSRVDRELALHAPKFVSFERKAKAIGRAKDVAGDKPVLDASRPRQRRINGDRTEADMPTPS